MTNSIGRAFEDGFFAVTLLTSNLDESIAFYGQKLGLAKVWGDDVSAVYKCGATMINLLAESQANELLAPAKMAKSEDGARAIFTLRVADVDAVVADLQTAGIELLNGPIDRPWGVRTASFADPSGHVFEIADHK
jgi:catechol 2,3-dioxygenase-like lactoylglutathione lyase family enzyme